MKEILITSPILPDFEEFTESLREIWSTSRLTNNGPFLQRFESALADYLEVPYVSVMTNGTLPIILSFKALGITEGEVITTPYTFVATPAAVSWSGLTPVFADVDYSTGNLDAQAVEAAITPRTRAILGVHVYGVPCCDEALRRVARAHGLPIIYDAAHAFGVRENGKSILLNGDLSTLSFHATKVFNTIEGGAVVCKTKEMKQRLDALRNFGITGETTFSEAGINAKLDEVRAAYGLLNLRKVDVAIQERRAISRQYSEALKSVAGIRLMEIPEGLDYNFSHYPIYIEESYSHPALAPFAQAGKNKRDQVYDYLMAHDIHPRRYFYPLPFHAGKIAAAPCENAKKISSQVLCLPIYPGLPAEILKKITSLLVP